MPAAQVDPINLLLNFYDLCLQIHLDFGIVILYRQKSQILANDDLGGGDG